MKFLLIIFFIIIFFCDSENSNAQFKGGSYSGYFSAIDTNAIVGITKLSGQADDFSLQQNYPNPFNPVTVIDYSIKTSGKVSVKIYDLLGNEVATLVNERQSVGSYSVTFDARNYSSGVYFYKLVANNYSETKKMLLTK